MSVACIYKIFCLDERIKDIYIGSSYNIIKRMNNHKSDCNNKMSLCYNYPVYKFIRENGGIYNYNVEVIEILDDNISWFDMKKREQEYIDMIKPSLNRYRSYITDAERILYRSLYYRLNKSRINARRHKKINCMCGGKYTVNNKSQHLKTKKHKRLCR